MLTLLPARRNVLKELKDYFKPTQVWDSKTVAVLKKNGYLRPTSD